MLFLPKPTGNIAIDAKFPLETYKRLTDYENTEDRKALEQQFRQDIKVHINAIADKYIIQEETPMAPLCLFQLKRSLPISMRTTQSLLIVT